MLSVTACPSRRARADEQRSRVYGLKSYEGENIWGVFLGNLGFIRGSVEFIIPLLWLFYGVGQGVCRGYCHQAHLHWFLYQQAHPFLGSPRPVM